MADLPSILGGMTQGFIDFGKSAVDLFGTGGATIGDLIESARTGKITTKNQDDFRKWLYNTDSVEDASAKGLGTALNGVQTAVDFIPGIGAVTKNPLFNAGQGALGGLADEFKMYGKDYDLGRAGERAAVGAGGAVAASSLGDALKQSANPLLSSGTVQGLARGATGGAIGAGGYTAIEGGDLNDIMNSAAQGAGMGAAIGGATGALQDFKPAKTYDMALTDDERQARIANAKNMLANEQNPERIAELNEQIKKYGGATAQPDYLGDEKYSKLVKKAKNYKTLDRFEKMNNPIKGSEIWGEKPKSYFERDSRAVRINMFPNDATKGTGLTKQYLLNMFKDAYDDGITDIVPSYGSYTKEGASFMNHLADQGWVKQNGRNGYNSYEIAPKIAEWQKTNPLADIYNAANGTAPKSLETTLADVDNRQAQFDLLQKTNPMRDDYHTGIRSPEDIRTLKSIVDSYNADNNFTYPDFTLADAQKALASGNIDVYSSKPIEAGAFISPSKMMATDYAGGGEVYTKNIPLRDFAFIESGDEGNYLPTARALETTLADADMAVNAPSENMKLYRGISAPDDATLQRYIDEMKDPNIAPTTHSGGSAYGQGYYFTPDEGLARYYANESGLPSTAIMEIEVPRSKFTEISKGNGNRPADFDLAAVKRGVPEDIRYETGLKDFNNYLDSNGYWGSKTSGDIPTYTIMRNDAVLNAKRIDTPNLGATLANDDMAVNSPKLTPEQEAYFKDSVIRDENGNLIPMYHGTRGNFTVFGDNAPSDTSNSHSSVGNWFTPTKEGAKNFAGSIWYGDGEPRVMETYLNMKNPKIYESVDNSEAVDKLRKELDALRSEPKNLSDTNFYHRSMYDSNQAMRMVETGDMDMALKWLTDKGYDSDKAAEYIDELVNLNKLNSKRKSLQDSISDLKYGDAYERFRTDLYKVDGQTAEDANLGGIGMALNDRGSIKKYVDKLKSDGYDGIIIKGTRYDADTMGGPNDQYVVFDSNQIKSTSNRRPTSNADIYRALLPFIGLGGLGGGAYMASQNNDKEKEVK